MSARYCVDCLHCVGEDTASPRCIHPRVTMGEIDLVTGKPVSSACFLARVIAGAPCGRDGKFWEPRDA